MVELQLFRSRDLEKANLSFALFANIRFFESLAKRPRITRANLVRHYTPSPQA